MRFIDDLAVAFFLATLSVCLYACIVDDRAMRLLRPTPENLMTMIGTTFMHVS